MRTTSPPADVTPPPLLQVLFTKQQTKRTTVPEEMTFYLLHLSLFREYLEYEFSDLKKVLKFPFELERIIDDWVGIRPQSTGILGHYPANR